MSLLQKPRKGHSCQKYKIDFQSIKIWKKSRNNFSGIIGLNNLEKA